MRGVTREIGRLWWPLLASLMVCGSIAGAQTMPGRLAPRADRSLRRRCRSGMRTRARHRPLQPLRARPEPAVPRAPRSRVPSRRSTPVRPSWRYAPERAAAAGSHPHAERGARASQSDGRRPQDQERRRRDDHLERLDDDPGRRSDVLVRLRLDALVRAVRESAVLEHARERRRDDVRRTTSFRRRARQPSRSPAPRRRSRSRPPAEAAPARA